MRIKNHIEEREVLVENDFCWCYYLVDSQKNEKDRFKDYSPVSITNVIYKYLPKF